MSDIPKTPWFDLLHPALQHEARAFLRDHADYDVDQRDPLTRVAGLLGVAANGLEAQGNEVGAASAQELKERVESHMAGGRNHEYVQRAFQAALLEKMGEHFDLD